MINKSLLSNAVALMLVIVGYLMAGPYQRYILNTGLFALSGGITNWLKIELISLVVHQEQCTTLTIDKLAEALDDNASDGINLE